MVKTVGVAERIAKAKERGNKRFYERSKIARSFKKIVKQEKGYIPTNSSKSKNTNGKNRFHLEEKLRKEKVEADDHIAIAKQKHEAEKEEKIKGRQKQARLMRKTTNKGQKLMKHEISRLLAKIQKE